MYSPHYPIPPPSYMAFDYTTSPLHGGGDYFSPKYNLYTPTKPSARGHARGASYEPAGYAYANPRPYQYQTPPVYETYFPSPYVKPIRTDFAVATERMRSKARAFGVKVDTKSSKSKHHGSRRDYSDDEYSPTGTPPPPYHDQFYDRAPSYKQAEPVRTRPRKRTNSTPTPVRPTSSRSKESKPAPKVAPQATAADAAAARIPAGYSLKNWDPAETPILLLGSVFDANSLGKWIYDWTVYSHGPASPMADQAGELWLGLIQLAGKIKRSEEVLPRVRRRSDREMLEEFLISGERLWKRFKDILKICEEFMWRAAKKESRRSKTVAMGANSGREFVESIFGRDRQLESTEQLMVSMRLWTMRFDANCEDILRHPSG